MIRAFATVLLVVATAAQPLLAIPAACAMGGEHAKMTCASCCALNPCCAPADQGHSTPVSAVENAASHFAAAIPSPAIVVPRPLVRDVQYRAFAHVSAASHAPPALALSCIQLI